ncbi:bestrophin-like domain [Streptomyces sp. NPDC055103]
MVEAADERSVARQTRLSEAAPAIPPVVYWFMVVSFATIGAFAFAFGLPVRRGPAHLVLLLVLAGIFTGSLLLIEDIDRPFSGHIHISSTSMEDTVADFAEDHPGRPLPCDGQGARTGR